MVRSRRGVAGGVSRRAARNTTYAGGRVRAWLTSHLGRISRGSTCVDGRGAADHLRRRRAGWALVS